MFTPMVSLLFLLRKFLVVLLIAFLLSPLFIATSANVFAAISTPEARSFKYDTNYDRDRASTPAEVNSRINSGELDRNNHDAADKSGNIVENLEKAVKNTTDTIVEKLNLNEPLPESTKEFLDSTLGGSNKDSNLAKPAHNIPPGNPNLGSVGNK
jgi:hypothetical protein